MHTPTLQELINRSKSFAWRAGSMVVVSVGTYILKIGDIYLLDWRLIVNLSIMTTVALLLAEGTKFLNKK